MPKKTTIYMGPNTHPPTWSRRKEISQTTKPKGMAFTFKDQEEGQKKA